MKRDTRFVRQLLFFSPLIPFQTMFLSFKRIVTWPHSRHSKRRVLGTTIKFDVTLNNLIARLIELETTQVIIGLDFDRAEMRDDGWPRTNAIPRFPGVLLLIECPDGPLLLACDTYIHWLHNLHALTVVLDNLRQAALHEVVSAQELYRALRPPGREEWLANHPFGEELSDLRIVSLGRGKWKATIPTKDQWQSSRPTQPPPPRSKAKTPPRNPQPRFVPSEGFSTRDKAAAWLADKTGASALALLSDERTFVEAYRLAARMMHPDVGGEAAQFRRLQNAKTAIERGAPWIQWLDE